MRDREVGEVESGNSIVTLKVTVSDNEAMKVKLFLQFLHNNKVWEDLHVEGKICFGVKCEPETIPKWLFNEQEAEKVKQNG